MNVEDIIKKNNLGPGLLVKFSNDPKEYVIRNISPDRRGLFVTLNGLQVYYKPISQLIQVNRKYIKESQMENILVEKQSIEDMKNELARLEANLQTRYNDYNDDDFWVNLSPEVKRLWKSKTYDLENEIQKLKKRIQRASLKEEEHNRDKEIDYITGGLADNLTLEDIAKKWASEYYDIENLIPELQLQLEKGIKIELEHTDDPNIAREIALDHLMENPKYYTNLETVENNAENQTISIENKINLREQLQDIITQLETLLINKDIKLTLEQKQNIIIALNKLKETKETCETAIDTFISTQKEVLTDDKREITHEQIIEKFFEEILKEKSDFLMKESEYTDDLIVTEDITSELGYYTTNPSEIYKLKNNNTEHTIVLDFENIYDLTPDSPQLDSKILSNITVDNTPISPQLIIIGPYQDIFKQVLQKLNCII